MGELLSEIGDLVFSLVIGYIGAIEFLYVVRHLYHWSFNHENPQDNDADSLAQMQERIRQQIENAAGREDAAAGITAMQDGVTYKDGFRIDANQAETDRLKEEINKKQEKEKRREELEQELAKQKKIEEETRKQLQEAEAALARQQREAEENERKLLEAEQKREREQREREEKEENERKLLAAEKQREIEQRNKEEAEENERKIIESEKQKELEQRQRELKEEHEKSLLEMERNLEHQIQAEDGLTESERQLIESIKQREETTSYASHDEDNDLLNRLMQVRQQQLDDESEDEQSLRLLQNERDQEQKQRRIEENALLFLEAEMKMAAELETKREHRAGMESAPQTPAIEEPCIKRTLAPLQDAADANTSPKHSVKTQLSQRHDDSYSLSTKALVFPGVSDDASSIEPESSQKSSFSTQPSDELTNTGNETHYMQQPQIRLEPEGEDNTPSQQYTEDYLRSLDGIKQRPLIREDGSGRRRAYKKRRSSGSSNSSRDSRTSRDEELKMFTSLEEEEMKNTTESEFTPIRYSSEPMLKVKNHHRRHKRSPAKDMNAGDDSLRSSLERLGEETTNPWGEVVPEHYKNTEFWKREKALSIDEEIEFEKPLSSEEMAYDTATNLPSASSFEEATQVQNEEAITTLKKQQISQQLKVSRITFVKFA